MSGRKIFLYKITNSVNGKTYCGQTMHVQYRWAKHCKRAEVNNGKRKGAIASAIRKYGRNVFTVETVGYALSRASADIAEKALIAYWSNKGPTYNRAIGGEGGIGWTFSKETKLKQRKSAIKRFSKRSERLKQSNRLKKAFENPALRMKISTLVKRSMTPEVRKRISEGTRRGMRKVGYGR